MKRLLTTLLAIALAANAYSQDYLISFEGSGDITTVDSTIINNLTQGTSLIVYGNDQLLLVDNITGVNSMWDNEDNILSIYPNPSTEYSMVEFNVPQAGVITTELYDISGKRVLQNSKQLEKGSHSLQISGLGSGFYNINIRSTDFSYSGKIVSQSNTKGLAQMNYTEQAYKPVNGTLMKSKNAEVEMQYNTDDRLKLTAYSGNYSTVIIDIPTESKSISFNFVECTDKDENNYSVVEIGAQTWMAVNLKTTKFPGGTEITLVESNTAWDALTLNDIAYSFYDNSSSYANTYGALYTWGAAMDGAASSDNNPSGVQGVCPDGWHLPSDAEWTELVNYLGGESTAGGKMKSVGTILWKSPNSGATNESGFSALPGGYRNTDGAFITIEETASFWSATMDASGFSWFHYLRRNYTNLERSTYNRPGGLSVRCVKDQE